MRELARRRLLPTCALLALATGVASSAAAGPAAAAQSSGTGPEGQRVTVSTTTGLDRGGETVTVQGDGFDTSKGIYVAYCVDNGPGALPSPCGGGADTSGSLGASHWISDNPPSYAGDLAVPYGPGGSFSVTLRLTPTIGDIDCLAGGCAVVTRADHTRGADRTQDVRVPVRFAGSGGGEPGGGQHSDGDRDGTSDGGGNDGGSTAGSGSDRNGAAAPGDGDSAGPEPAGGAVPAPSVAATPAPEELSIARVSSSGTAGTWWWTATASLAAVLIGLMITNRVIRRRRAAR